MMWDSTDRAILAAALCMAALLVLPGIGDTALWSDEAETALVARNILQTGVPSASDGKFIVSIFPDRHDVQDGIYYWQPWLQMYLAAASMAVFGATSFAARLPFCLAFIGLIGISYRVFRRWHPDRQVAVISIALMLGSIPLLLHARQCRYYLLIPLFSVLVANAYLRLLEDPKFRRAVPLTIWATLLFNSLYPSLVILGFALGLDVWRRRPSLQAIKVIGIAAAATLVLNLPIAIYCRVWHRPFGLHAGYSSLETFGAYLLRYVITLNNYFFPLILVALACAWRWRDLRSFKARDNQAVVLCATFCATQVFVITLTTNYPFSRYLIGIAPFALFLAALCICALAAGRRWVAGVLVAAVILTNLFQLLPLQALRQTPLQDAQWTLAGVNHRYLELGNAGVSYALGEVKALINISPGLPLPTYIASTYNPSEGPMDSIIRYLNENAKPGDHVKISYGDLPLAFHTDLNIINSALVGRPGAQWRIDRHFNRPQVSKRYEAAMRQFKYEAIELPVPDLQWNNRPDPLYHHYATPPEHPAPKVKIFKLIR
jgi:4-amino-4-deoxy-L-arabinose transferase-like glycosyltransferase